MTNNGKSGSRRGRMAPAATAALVIILLVLITGAGQVLLNTSQHDTSGTASSLPTQTVPSQDERYVTSHSAATRLAIPAIGVNTRLGRLGTAETDTIELPPATGAGWYTESVAPGQIGVCILAGYIRRTEAQPGVFDKLRELRAGDDITVRRKDGRVAVYDVRAITPYATGDFPAERFYSSNGRPILRIVTTGGRIRPSAPQGNVIVDADLVDVR